MAAKGSPRIAVVVPTRDRPEMVRRCLAALAAQTRAADEVLLVDDASDQPLGPVVAPWRTRLPLTLLRTPAQGGPGAARNLGWRSTQAEQVAFTDDDCRPEPGWLAAFEAQTAPRTVLVGRTMADPADGEPHTVFDRAMEVLEEDGRFSTCNVAYPRALLEELGGFDPRFRRYGEDTDLGRRALAVGATARFVPDALVLHALHRGGWRGALRDRLRFTDVALLVRRHPSVRERFESPLFFRRQHRLLLLAALGLAATPRDPETGLRLARLWAADSVHRIPLAARNGPRSLAGQLLTLGVLDTVELAACGWGSLRHGTVVL